MHESYDQIIEIGNSILQYGAYNKRVYILHLEEKDTCEVLTFTDKIVKQLELTKVIGKIPQNCRSLFDAKGYRTEATIPLFYRDSSDTFFSALYCNGIDRQIEKKSSLIEQILSLSNRKKNSSNVTTLPASYRFQKMEKKDIPVMASLYQAVFPSYPFPIHNPAYLSKTMESHVDYFGVLYHQDLVALSSIERSQHTPTAEMTDFATLPAFRSKGLAGFLLKKMEAYIHDHYTIQTLYTIARAYSFGINTIFAKDNYCFGGTLTNNTNILGQIESMNIWYKHTSHTPGD